MRFRFPVAALVVAALLACVPNPVPGPAPSLSATATPTSAPTATTPTTTPAPETPTPSPTATPFELVLPGQSIQMKWHWDTQGPPSQGLEVALAGLHSPDDVGAYLASRYTWRDTYDTSHYLSPDELLAQSYGVCSAFARFWAYALERQGFRVDVLSFWGADTAHSVAVWRDAGGQFRLASNQAWSPLTDLGLDRDAALVAAAAEFYGSTWSTILVHDPLSGQLRQVVRNPAVPAIDIAPPAGRNVFTITR